MEPTRTQAAYREAPDNPKWWTLCVDHDYWSVHGGRIGYRTTHCPLCPQGRDFYAVPATDLDPPLPSEVARDRARTKVWRQYNKQAGVAV